MSRISSSKQYKRREAVTIWETFEALFIPFYLPLLLGSFL